MFTAYLTASLLLAVPTCVGHVLHESLAAVPQGWEKVSEPSSDATINLEVALNMNNIDQMVEQLYAVSTPGSASYGQHWSKEQVDNLVSASDEAVQATVGWLNDANITSTVVGNSVHFSSTVGQAEKLLNTKFSHYRKDGVTKLRTTQYHVDESVSEHIDLIHPTTFFGQTQAHAAIQQASRTVHEIVKRKTTPDPSCITGLTPACVRQLYNIPANYTPPANSGSFIGFGSFLNESAQESDVLLFEKRYGFPNQTFDVVTINNGVNNQSEPTGIYGDVGEANLDIQNIIGVAHGLPVREYITGGSPPFKPDLTNPTDTNEPYLQYYNYLLAQDNQNLPQVLSNSYGDDEQTVPRNYATRVCNLIGMMGLRGITVLESSGDGGIGTNCLTNDKKPKLTFNPQFPATCPYITAVGGTQGIPEIAWLGSGGGFSDYFPRPSYQETAVNTYLNKHVTSETALYYSQYANFSGRGFPDIAAVAASPYYYGYYNGKLSRNGGTSASTPVVAGILGLLNAARLNAGKPALGFFNPLLYSSGYKAFTDITAGNSTGCNGVNYQSGAAIPGGGIIPYAHWNATLGWDPVTGYGSPNFEKLLKYVLSV